MKEFDTAQKQLFIETCFDGDVQAYLKARKENYRKVQNLWVAWLDDMLIDGEITKKQYENASF